MDEFLERGMPQDLEAERACLGGILLDNLLISEAQDLLDSDDFYLDSHQRIFRAMLFVSSQSSPIDFISLTGRLRDQAEFERVGGATYIASLIDGVPRQDSLKYYAARLRQKSIARKAIRIGARLQARMLEGEDDNSEILSDHTKEILELNRAGDQGGLVHVGPIAQKALERIEALCDFHQARAAVSGIPSGHTDVDAFTCGWQRQDLIILAARPSQGKTALAMDWAQSAASAGNVVAVFSLEMSAERLMTRSLAGQAKIDSHRIASAYLNRDDWRDLAGGLRRIHDMKLWVDDSSGVKTNQVRSRCERLKLEQGRLDLIVIDYLQLMANNHPHPARNREQEVAEICRELKAIAKDLNCPLIALSQFSMWNVLAIFPSLMV